MDDKHTAAPTLTALAQPHRRGGVPAGHVRHAAGLPRGERAHRRRRVSAAAAAGSIRRPPLRRRARAGGTSTTAMWLPSGSRSMNSSGAPGVRIGSGSTSTPSGAQPLVLGQDVRRLHADPAPAGLPAAHRRVEREAGPRAGRGDLQPAVLAVLAEPRVAAHLEAELLGVEGEGGVLVGDGEHDHADVGDGGRDRGGGSSHARWTARAHGTHRLPARKSSRCPRFAGRRRGSTRAWSTRRASTSTWTRTSASSSTSRPRSTSTTSPSNRR